MAEISTRAPRRHFVQLAFPRVLRPGYKVTAEDSVNKTPRTYSRRSRIESLAIHQRPDQPMDARHRVTACEPADRIGILRGRFASLPRAGFPV
jgi:hypothetical protein